MRTIRDFVIRKSNLINFETEAFTDITELHQYFITPKRSEKDFIDKYEAINEILDCYSDLRSIAEKECNRSFNVQVYNRKNELPVDLSKIIEYFEERKDINEPPTRLITRIAQDNFHTVYTLVNNMHKVLQRQRSLVPLDRVQQQDAQCIRWLIRQPGRNNIERAGNKQKLMAVVRYETSNTLENRVLKHFMKLCLIECDSYLRQFNRKGSDQYEKIKSVKALRNLVRYALELPKFKNITNLYSIPHPNYVLRNNSLYKTIWDYYLLLLKKTKVIESVWANRHKVYADFVKLLYVSLNHKAANPTSNVRHTLWLRQFPDSNGEYFTPESWIYYDYDLKNSISYRFISVKGFLRYTAKFTTGSINETRPLFTAFIPDHTKDFMIGNESSMILAYDESGQFSDISISRNLQFITPSTGIVDKIYEMMKEICNVRN